MSNLKHRHSISESNSDQEAVSDSDPEVIELKTLNTAKPSDARDDTEITFILTGQPQEPTSIQSWPSQDLTDQLQPPRRSSLGSVHFDANLFDGVGAISRSSSFIQRPDSITDSIQAPASTRSRRTTFVNMPDSSCAVPCGLGVLTVAALLVVILVPLSFSDLEYYEMGFTQRISTGKVDTSKVYTGGRHFVGVDYKFKKFKADLHVEVFSKITIFNKEKLQVTMTCTLEYFLRQYDLKYLHDKYNLAYKAILRKQVESALKTAATEFTVNEYRKERKKVMKALFNASRVALGGKCCPKDCSKFTCWTGCKTFSSCKEEDEGMFAEVAYFQLEMVDITYDQEQRFLRQVIEQEKQDTEKFKQNEKIERKRTEQFKKKIENQALEVFQNATAKASLLKANAAAHAKAVTEDARNSGLQILYNKLKITKESHKKTLDYVRVLRDHGTAYMYINFKTLIAKE